MKNTEQLMTSMYVQLTVTDPDSIVELQQHSEDVEKYALGALRIGLLSLRQARGQVDGAAIKNAGEALILELTGRLESYRVVTQQGMAAVLQEYFDPSSGKLSERVDRLICRDGELEQVIARQVGDKDSRMVQTLGQHLGQDSPIMRMLNPQEAGSFTKMFQAGIADLLAVERGAVLAEFSLDRKESALSRLVVDLTTKDGKLKNELTTSIEAVVQEFSLDKKDSALSRLVAKVEQAQQRITDEFSLNSTDSALSRLRRELLTVLEENEKKAQLFQQEVKQTFNAMQVRKDESLRSTTHGAAFEQLVVSFTESEMRPQGDVTLATGNTPGLIKYCKVGDAVVELGTEHVAAGEKFVLEAKEDASYDLAKARNEIETARKNRGAGIGIFVFSAKTGPKNQSALFRVGDDIFIVWDAEDAASDVIFRAALSLAKALCVRRAQVKKADAGDFLKLESSILQLEKETERLVSLKTWAETIQSNSTKILDEVRKMTENVARLVVVLKESATSLKQLSAGVV